MPVDAAVSTHARYVFRLISLSSRSPPGVGKTSVVEMEARKLTGSPLAVESYTGREVTVDLVRD